MGGVAGIVAPVFAIIALGAAALHWRVMDSAGLRGITDLTLYIGLPALLFSAAVEAASFAGIVVVGTGLSLVTLTFLLALLPR